MSDRVRGKVVNILGGDTFEMQITDVGQFNENDYRNSERIRIAGINDPDLYPGNMDQRAIEKLKDKEVRCFVMARDEKGMVVAVVQCIN